MQYSDPRDNRFDSWNSKSGYYENDRMLTAGLPRTDSTTSLQDTSKFIPTSRAITSQLYNQNKSKFLLKDGPGMTKYSSKSSTNFTKSFINPQSLKKSLESKYDESIWQESFSRYVTPVVKNATARDHSHLMDDFIPVSCVASVVTDCLGTEAPSFLMDMFLKLSASMATKERFISWSDFKDIVPQVISSYISGVDFKAGTPALVKLMSKPRLVDPGMGPIGGTSTVYLDTISSVAPGVEDMNQNQNTCKSPSSFLVVKANPTSSLLNAGTPKQTLQLPGYQGHIPINNRNVKKNEHSFGADIHPVKNDLILTTKLSILGYSGHFSSAGHGVTDRQTGCDPRTSNGAAYGPSRRML